MYTSRQQSTAHHILKQLAGHLNPILLSLYAMLSISRLLIVTHLLQGNRGATIAYSHLRSFNAAGV